MVQNITVEPTVTYRQTTPMDARAMEKLNLATLPENYNINEWEIALQYMSCYSYVAHVNDELVGYCLATLTPDYPNNKNSYVGTIASLAVKEEWRRKGIAKKLLIKSLLSLQKCTTVMLNVRVSNIKAITLYKKMGFIQDKIIQKYYQDGEDSFLMIRASK